MFSGMVRPLIASWASARSSPSICRETPPARGLFGIATKYLPAKLRKVVKAAPLFPRSSFSTWTITSCPSRSSSLILLRLCNPLAEALK